MCYNSKSMTKFAFPIMLLFLVSAYTIGYVADAQSCNSCNCQFNNVQVLTRLVEAEVNRKLADEPLVRMVRIWMNANRELNLQAFNHSTLLATDATPLAQIIMTDSSQPYSSNLLAYRPRYNDYHGSGLGAIFINLEGIFPCLAPLDNYYPVCTTFSDEEDGFRSGRTIVDAGDIGNNFQIFSTTVNIATYGIALQQCPELNSSCFPDYHSVTVACYLPRAACSS